MAKKSRPLRRRPDPLIELRRQLKEAKAENKALVAQVAKAARLKDNLGDRRAPLDLEQFAVSSAEHTRSKKQEYSHQMGEFADMLQNPRAYTPEDLQRIARFTSALTEDEGRFVSRKEARLIAIHYAREELFLRRFAARAKPLFHGKIAASGFARAKPRQQAERILNLHLSDLHVGARLDAKEFPRESTPETEARRLGFLALETAEYKSQYREKTSLNLYLNGDMIAGLLRHSYAYEEDPITDQFNRCVKMLAQAVAYLAKHFPQVRIYCQSGNHGRNISVHPGRATAQKWDSFETCIYIALKMACAALQNVKVEIPKTPYCAVPLFDSWAFVTHGDTTINVGNPASKVDIAAIVKQINAINASAVYGKRFSLVMTGHVHTALALHYPGGMLMVNGAGTPPNGHALSLGFFDACAQWLHESVKGYPVGDMRLLRLDESIDRDRTYEKIVSPVTTF